MTYHFNVTDIKHIIDRADAGDNSAMETIQRNAQDWIRLLVGTVFTDWQAVHRLEKRLARLPITAQQAEAADALIERFAPALPSTTDVQVALGNLVNWIKSNGEYPRLISDGL